MNVNGSKWRITKVYEDKWWYKDLCDGVWMSMPPYGCMWKYIMVFESKW